MEGSICKKISKENKKWQNIVWKDWCFYQFIMKAFGHSSSKKKNSSAHVNIKKWGQQQTQQNKRTNNTK